MARGAVHPTVTIMRPRTTAARQLQKLFVQHAPCVRFAAVVRHQGQAIGPGAVLGPQILDQLAPLITPRTQRTLTILVKLIKVRVLEVRSVSVRIVWLTVREMSQKINYVERMRE